MTYIHFELLLIYNNKYRTRDLYRVRESRDRIQRPKERSSVLEAKVSIYSFTLGFQQPYHADS